MGPVDQRLGRPFSQVASRLVVNASLKKCIVGLLVPIAIYVTTANGMQDKPNSWHLDPLEWSLQASAARAAAPQLA